MTNPILSETEDMIETLQNEAAAAGDEAMVEMCQRVLDVAVELIDSDSGEQLTAAELGVDAATYVEACCRSLDCRQAEGHIAFGDRRVYAG